MTITVLRPGQLTTVQDLGRNGRQHEGVPESGAMDRHAARLVNLLVGNDDSSALLEVTLTGPTLRFGGATAVAIGGADFGATLDDEPVARWKTIRVVAGSTLELRAARDGCRAYIAIAGGIDVPVVLGSRSTCLVASFGGYQGRALRAGDELAIGASRADPPRRSLAASLRPVYRSTIRLVAGEHLALLDDGSRAALFGGRFAVSPRSDRMGYRLDGERLALREPVELLSGGVPAGAVQLPPGGAPIVLMADHQTTGGYPIVAHVASVDLGSVAQLRPGDAIAFSEISLDEAQRLYLERERSIDALRRTLHTTR